MERNSKGLLTYSGRLDTRNKQTRTARRSLRCPSLDSDARSMTNSLPDVTSLLQTLLTVELIFQLRRTIIERATTSSRRMKVHTTTLITIPYKNTHNKTPRSISTLYLS